MPDKNRNAFICGFPVRHSRSPIIHNYWLKLYGIDGSYGLREVEPEDFDGFINSLSAEGYVGGNVTIPHKEAAFQLVDHRDAAAEAIGAVNTVWLEDGKLIGSNTDGYGFAANLDERAPAWDMGKIATVLGAGGASRAIIHALRSRGFTDIRIINRTVSRAQALCDHFGTGTSAHGWDAFQALLSDCDLLVNTTSLGMEGGETIAFDLAALPDHAVVTDIVYIPLETPILKLAAERGLRTVDGLGMLLHQAVPGFERWFGKRPEVTEALRALIIADMEKAH